MDNIASIQTLLNQLVDNQQDGKSYLNIPSYCAEHKQSERQLLADLKALEELTTVQPVDGRLVFCRLIVGWNRTDEDILTWLSPFLCKPSPTEHGFELSQVSEILGVSRRTIYSYLNDHRLNAAKVGAKYFVSQEEIDRFLKGGESK